MAIAHISVGDVESISKINQAIDQANLVPAKADQSALDAEISARKSAIAAVPVAEQVNTRPGDAVPYFTSSLDGGDPALLPSMDATRVRFDDAGYVIRQVGDGIVASRALYPLEPGRKYLVEYAVQRRVNSPDPDNDAIKCAIAWYDQVRGAIGQATVQNLLGVTTGSGRLTVQAVVSRSAADDVNIVSPAAARYCRPFVQTYGTLVQSDIEVIRWTDITNAAAYSPDLTALEGRTTALESVDAGDRLTALEGQVTSPNSMRYATVGDLVAATVPVSVDTVELLGYSAAGDGGAALYKRVDSEPPHAGKVQSADGAWWELASEHVNVKMLGAKGDGSTYDTQSIQDANDFLAARGGGTLYYPEGTYVVHKLQASGTNPNVAILASDKVIHQGAGVGATKLFLANGEFASVFFARSLTDAGICHMTIDGNRDNQGTEVSDGHDPCCILLGDSVTRVELHHLVCDNALDYAIGIQVAYAKDSCLHDIIINNAGADGFDNKNTGVGTTNCRMYNMTVNGFGMQGETGEIFAGIDMRGDWTIENIRINNLGYGKGSTSGRHGLRWENSGSTDPSTGGGANSVANNIYISGYGTTYQSDGSVQGIVLRDRGIKVSNFYIENIGRGITRGQRNTVISDGVIVACRRGFVEDSTLTHQGSPLPTYPVYGAVSNVVIRDCTEMGMRLEGSVVGNTYEGIVLDNNVINVSMAVTASGNVWIGGANLNATTQVTGGDGTNKFIEVKGFVTFNRVISGYFNIDSTGTKTITVSHGLSATPQAQGVQISLVKSTQVSDFAIGYMAIASITGTSITIEVNVSTASATPGAQARIAVEAARYPY